MNAAVNIYHKLFLLFNLLKDPHFSMENSFEIENITINISEVEEKKKLEIIDKIKNKLSSFKKFEFKFPDLLNKNTKLTVEQLKQLDVILNTFDDSKKIIKEMTYIKIFNNILENSINNDAIFYLLIDNSLDKYQLKEIFHLIYILSSKKNIPFIKSIITRITKKNLNFQQINSICEFMNTLHSLKIQKSVDDVTNVEYINTLYFENYLLDLLINEDIKYDELSEINLFINKYSRTFIINDENIFTFNCLFIVIYRGLTQQLDVTKAIDIMNSLAPLKKTIFFNEKNSIIFFGNIINNISKNQINIDFIKDNKIIIEEELSKNNFLLFNNQLLYEDTLINKSKENKNIIKIQDMIDNQLEINNIFYDEKYTIEEINTLLVNQKNIFEILLELETNLINSKNAMKFQHLFKKVNEKEVEDFIEKLIKIIDKIIEEEYDLNKYKNIFKLILTKVFNLENLFNINYLLDLERFKFEDEIYINFVNQMVNKFNMYKLNNIQLNLINNFASILDQSKIKKIFNDNKHINVLLNIFIDFMIVNHANNKYYHFGEKDSDLINIKNKLKEISKFIENYNLTKDEESFDLLSLIIEKIFDKKLNLINELIENLDILKEKNILIKKNYNKFFKNLTSMKSENITKFNFILENLELKNKFHINFIVKIVDALFVKDLKEDNLNDISKFINNNISLKDIELLINEKIDENKKNKKIHEDIYEDQKIYNEKIDENKKNKKINEYTGNQVIYNKKFDEIWNEKE